LQICLPALGRLRQKIFPITTSAKFTPNMCTYLFKFYSLARYSHITIENLRRHRIYAQALGNLNDPFEGWWYQSDTESISSTQNKEFRSSLERYGIYSLCQSTDENFPISPASILLWAHYADSNRGFCIELSDEIKTIEEFGFKVCSVNYEDSLPDKNSLNSYSQEATKDKERILFWKGEMWKYENELRLCFKEPNKFHVIPQGCIKRIYCGCKMEENDIDVIKNLAQDVNAECIMLRRSIYNYGFVPINQNEYEQSHK